MHDWVTHNRHYATFNQFTEAIFDFFRTTLPKKGPSSATQSSTTSALYRSRNIK
jgi:hypothetical protein